MVVEKLLHALPATVWVGEFQFDLEVRIEPALPCMELGYFLVGSTFNRKLNMQELTEDQVEIASEGWDNPYLGKRCDYLFCVPQIENTGEMLAAITNLKRELLHRRLYTVD